MTLDPLREGEVLRVARALVELGAHTRLVRALTGLSARKTRALYASVEGRAPARGNRTKPARWFVATPERRLEASRFRALHEFVRAFGGQSAAETLIQSFLLYRKLGRRRGPPVPTLDIEAAHALLGLIDRGAIESRRCPRCRCKVIALAPRLGAQGQKGPTSPPCPLCQPFTRTARPTARPAADTTGGKRPSDHQAPSDRLGSKSLPARADNPSVGIGDRATEGREPEAVRATAKAASRAER